MSPGETGPFVYLPAWKVRGDPEPAEQSLIVPGVAAPKPEEWGYAPVLLALGDGEQKINAGCLWSSTEGATAFLDQCLRTPSDIEGAYVVYPVADERVLLALLKFFDLQSTSSFAYNPLPGDAEMQLFACERIPKQIFLPN